MSLALFLGILAAGLFFEGLFAGSEMALISADRIALHKQAQAGSRGARTALALLGRPEQVLATTLVGTSSCAALQATAATIYVHERWGGQYDLHVVLVLAPLILFLGEILPKTVYQLYSERLAPRVAPFVQLARWCLTPATWTLGRFAGWLASHLNPLEEAITGRHHPSHREELRYLLTYGQKETSLKTSERRMIRRILDFSRAEARKALIPLVNVDMIEDTLTVDGALEAFIRFGHSRLPVYHERVDNIVGVLHVFDLFSEQDGGKPITRVMQPAFYAPESQQLEKLLFTTQKRGIQMAIIVDEYGGAVGILTLEDILEEVVGEIKDEYDPETSLYRELGESELLIQGRMEITAINELLKLGLPKGSYETLAGFLLQQFNRIPEEGDELYFGRLKFIVRKASNRVIQAVHVTILE